MIGIGFSGLGSREDSRHGRSLTPNPEHLSPSMSSALSPTPSPHGRAVEAAWRRLSARRRLYTGILILVIGWALASSLRYADDANAGSFFDRLPHFLDFTSWLLPADWN